VGKVTGSQNEILFMNDSKDTLNIHEIFVPYSVGVSLFLWAIILVFPKREAMFFNYAFYFYFRRH
jgi:hypothetical protein